MPRPPKIKPTTVSPIPGIRKPPVPPVQAPRPGVQGGVILNEEGSWNLGEDGSTMIEDLSGDDCCLSSCPACRVYGDRTPIAYRCEFTELQLCTSCDDAGPGSYVSRIWTSGGGSDPNGTYLVPSTGVACVYELAFQGPSFIRTTYVGEGCSGTIVGQPMQFGPQCYIRLWANAIVGFEYRLIFDMWAEWFDGPSGGNTIFGNWGSSWPGEHRCEEQRTFENWNGADLGPLCNVPWKTGQATITPVFQ